MDSRSAHVLVVDDDPKVRLLLRRCLEGEGYRVSEAGDGPAALRAVEASPPDLVTLDIGLPGQDGLAVAREIRSRAQTPIIMVTGKGDPIDRVIGLELGADDYVAKPFILREVLARVRAVLRRTDAAAGTAPGPAGRGQPNSVFHFAQWRFDIPRRELRDPADTICELTTAEFGLLEVFVRNANRVLSRDEIMDLTKGHDWSPFDRTIDNLVAKLRKKLEADPEHPVLIKTVRGVGYSFTGAITKIM